ncbi:FERM domain-containing protein 8-like isoform X2 [Xenia sp. Carnegie-2017]|uniref:FERM domain-containing protein 8-like isoform X2 n=1 Tax=Xenia sp. Carnegie-2017 TaxID=2897299 RepID=UPI001F04A35D|nr:FERM domain-containing protein 8-like isoform X2 [Xenia sp. Carnegie-2017]
MDDTVEDNVLDTTDTPSCSKYKSHETSPGKASVDQSKAPTNESHEASLGKASVDQSETPTNESHEALLGKASVDQSKAPTNKSHEASLGKASVDQSETPTNESHEASLGKASVDQSKTPTNESHEASPGKASVDQSETPTNESHETSPGKASVGQSETPTNESHETSPGKASIGQSETPAKKTNEKSSLKSRANRPQHLMLPKAWQRSLSTQSNGSQQGKAISVAVYLVEKIGRLLNLEYGKDTTAGVICKMMVENLAMSSQAKDVFCIWIISPLLQLQLKEHHQPLRMRMKWPDLLKRFTTASSEMIEKDEPILSFQRNSFFSLQEEKKITDEKIIKRLFEEAKHNVLNGFYPVTRQQGEMFGAILALTEYGKFCPQIHKVGYFRNKLPELVPYWMYKPGWHTILGRSTKATIEQCLLNQYKNLSNSLDENELESCQNGRHFLKKCWDLPFYGSVFFNGQIEKQVSGLNSLLDHHDIPVRVAINRGAVHVIEPKKNEILLGLSYDEFSWDYSHCPESTSNPECFDTFWLEFDSEEGEITQLQIYSKQAIMMDAMVQFIVL